MFLACLHETFAKSTRTRLSLNVRCCVSVSGNGVCASREGRRYLQALDGVLLLLHQLLQSRLPSGPRAATSETAGRVSGARLVPVE